MVGIDDLAARADVHPRHRRQLAALVEMLARDGVLSVVGDRVGRGTALVSGGQPDLQAEAARLLAAHPHFEPHLRLLEVCLEAYGDVLADRRPATEVMFPDLSMRLVEPMYKGSRLVDFCNGMVASTVAALRRATDKKPFRVLEFGAGTGGASTFVLPALARAGEGTRYLYTDVSLGFTQFGQRRFGKDFPFVEFRPLDISRDPLAQGYEPASFDVLLACNCIHATPRLGRSLAHCRSLLAPGGFLVLYEMTALHDFVTITFGLLDGWWNAQDERMPHAPLLTTAMWREQLAAAGFGAVEIFTEPGVQSEKDFRHSVIVARSGPAVPVEKSEAKAARAPLLRGRLRLAGAEAPAAPVRSVETPAKPASAPGDLVAAVRELVAETLEMRLADLRTDKSLADYGADSVLSVTLVEALGRRFGIDLKPTILFSHPTIEALAAHLASRHDVSLARAVPPAGPAPAGPAPAPRADAGGSTDPSRQPIAVIGMAGRFPGADDVWSFWDNLAAGRCSVGLVPRERWDHAAVYDPDPLVAGRTSCPNGGFLGDVASFDPAFFGLSPADAVAMDPQQRIFLEEAWHALEDAGCPASRLSESKTGIFVGTIASDYASYLESVGRLADAKSFMGNSPSMLAARIAYHLNLRGPCLSIDTACSSSLVAIHLACESLRRGECSVAIAGGVALMTTPAFYLVAGNAGMLSPTGQCRTLDEGADGFVPGEAAAVLVLKPLDAAMADGDRIYGVIRGSAVNQDGTSNGITAPRATAQTELVREVFERFDIDPSTLGYVELHGTGTKLGDPIEIDALREAFAGAAGRGFCGIGSVKSNIGHTLPAAGAVSLVKALLSLRNEAIPPTLHFSRPNRHLDLDGGPFFVPTSLRPWESRDGAPRRAAVSSFGFSGTNAHLVVEEAPTQTASTPLPGPHVVCLSAKTEAALARRIGDLARWMAEPQGQGGDIGDLAFTLATRRTHLEHRAVFVVSSLDDLRDQLSAAQARGVGPDGEALGSGAAADLARLFLGRDDEAFLAGFTALRRRVLSLPGYPFTRRRCWPVADAAAQAPAQTKPLDLFDLATGALAGNGGQPIGPMMGLSA